MNRSGRDAQASAHARYGRRRGALAISAIAAVLLAGILTWAAPSASAAASYTTIGSIKQVETWGHAVGTAVELHDATNALVASGTADAQGAFLFRNLTPAAGYTVQASGATSDPVTVTAPTDNPPDSFYNGSTTLNEGFGYITTRDGTKLSANVTFPKNGAPKPWPVLIDYSGYDPSQPNTTPQEAGFYPYLGYVVVGVNMRGTTCSGGAFWFFEDAQRTDGYDAVEAMAHQSWSNGNVGLVGISYSGYSQLYVASTRPPHLRAITPLSPFSDGYRGILYPGGILNNGFALSWATDRQNAARPANDQWVKDQINGGDTTCAQNQTLRLQSQNMISQITDGRFDDPTYSYLDPSTFAPLINVPTYLATQWQDEQTGGYGAELATMIAKNAKLRAVFTNGTHVDSLGPEVFLKSAEFVDLYVGKKIPVDEGNGFYQQGIASALSSLFGTNITIPYWSFGKFNTYADALAWYEAQAPISIRWENGAVSGKEGAPYATVTTTYPSWPIPTVTPQRWYLQPDGALSATSPTVPDSQARAYSTYTYDPTVKRKQTFDGATADMWLTHPDVHWLPDTEGKSLSFVTPAFTSKTTYAGNGSADLWVRSSAADTDFEVTLTDVRPDGKETVIQSGWLRASRRALDPAASTVLRPRETFQAADAAPLPAGQFVPVRIELFPFAELVRPGSRLRLNIEAPGGNQPFWAFADVAGTSTNDIGHSVGMPSSVVLPLLNDSRVSFYAPAAPPSCAVSGVTTQSESSRNQPCRDYLPTRSPTAVTGTPSGNQVNIAWQAPPTWPSGPALTSYHVTVSPTGDTIDVPAGTTTAVYTPTSGAPSLTFRVAAVYGTTTAPASDASAPVAMAVPSAVTAQPGNGTAAVSWHAPPGSSPAVTGYVVTPFIGAAAQTPQTFASTATTQTVTGLTNGTAYTFVVAATYSTGTGATSVPSAPVTVGAPSAPAFLRVTPGNSQATVSWWPANGNGVAITGSVITPYIGNVAQTPQTFNSSANYQTITGLTNGTTYTFLVSAVNSRGTGPGSMSPPALVNPVPPTAPSSVAATSANGTATVAWRAPSSDGGSAITGYVVTPYIGAAAQPAQTFNSTATQQTVTGLTNGSVYTFKVAAINAAGTGPQSAASAPITIGAPTQPGFLRVTPGPGQVVIKWWPPSDNGSPITGYVITPYIGSVAQTPRTTSTSNTQTITGLTSGTTYTFTVAATNARGTGPAGTTPAATPT